MEIVQLTTGVRQSEKGESRGESMAVATFAEIYDAYYKRVYKYICYRINNHYAAEEICSHVFEAVIAKYSSFSAEKASFEVWLFAIARNAVTDYFRSQKKRATFSLSALLHIAMPKSSPEEIVIRDDRHAALFQALAKLSDKERNIIGMKYAAGEKSVNFLISQGGENGIGTTEEVKTEVLAGTKVYFANGIVIWEQNGYTIEMNAREDFDSATLGKVIEGFTVGAALTQAEVEQAKEKYRSAVPAEGAGPVPAEGALPGNSNRCSPGSEKARRCFNAFCKSN